VGGEQKMAVVEEEGGAKSLHPILVRMLFWSNVLAW
jgi:hypothetical protein